MRETVDIEFIYVVVPLNANEKDNMLSIIGGVTADEFKNDKDKIIELDTLTESHYSSETAQKYLDAYNSGETSFF